MPFLRHVFAIESVAAGLRRSGIGLGGLFAPFVRQFGYADPTGAGKRGAGHAAATETAIGVDAGKHWYARSLVDPAVSFAQDYRRP